jgi:hypothetical protein
MLSAAAVFAAVSLLRLQLFWLLGAGAALGVSSGYQLSTTWPPFPASLRRGLAWSCRLALAGAIGGVWSASRRCSPRFCGTAGPQYSGMTGLGPEEEVLEIGCGWAPETTPFILWFRPQFQRAFSAADILQSGPERCVPEPTSTRFYALYGVDCLVVKYKQRQQDNYLLSSRG